MSSESGAGSVRAFIDAFNAQDHAALAATLNYPHVRLARGRFVTIDSAQDFENLSRANEPRLREEGWHHTVIRSLEVLHAGPDKVHIALGIDRCREHGEVYNEFDTFWIATLVDGHWGIQFRSSYL